MGDMESFSPALPMPNCPFCGVPYGRDAKTVIAARGEVETLHLCCTECLRSLAVSCIRTVSKVRSIGLLTDCNSSDYARFFRGRRVSIDDVITVHERLRA